MTNSLLPRDRNEKRRFARWAAAWAVAAFSCSLLCPTPAAASVAQAADGMVLERVVAVLAPGRNAARRILITLSDLEVETRVALIERGARAAAEATLPDDTLATSLDWLIAEHLLLAEAEQLELAELEAGAVERAIDRFRERFATEADWHRFLMAWELGEAELVRIFRRRLVVDGYLASRLRLGLVVTEADVRQAFDAKEARFDRGRYEELRPMLRAVLEKEKRESMVAALVGDVRRRAEVRVLTRLGRAPVDTGGEGEPAQSERPWYLPEAKETEG